MVVSVETSAGKYTELSRERARRMIEATISFLENNIDATDDELCGAFNDLADVYRVNELIE